MSNYDENQAIIKSIEDYKARVSMAAQSDQTAENFIKDYSAIANAITRFEDKIKQIPDFPREILMLKNEYLDIIQQHRETLSTPEDIYKNSRENAREARLVCLASSALPIVAPEYIVAANQLSTATDKLEAERSRAADASALISGSNTESTGLPSGFPDDIDANQLLKATIKFEAERSAAAAWNEKTIVIKFLASSEFKNLVKYLDKLKDDKRPHSFLGFSLNVEKHDALSKLIKDIQSKESMPEIKDILNNYQCDLGDYKPLGNKPSPRRVINTGQNITTLFFSMFGMKTTTQSLVEEMIKSFDTLNNSNELKL